MDAAEIVADLTARALAYNLARAHGEGLDQDPAMETLTRWAGLLELPHSCAIEAYNVYRRITEKG